MHLDINLQIAILKIWANLTFYSGGGELERQRVRPFFPHQSPGSSGEAAILLKRGLITQTSWQIITHGLKIWGDKEKPMTYLAEGPAGL